MKFNAILSRSKLLSAALLGLLGVTSANAGHFISHSRSSQIVSHGHHHHVPHHHREYRTPTVHPNHNRYQQQYYAPTRSHFSQNYRPGHRIHQSFGSPYRNFSQYSYQGRSAYRPQPYRFYYRGGTAYSHDYFNRNNRRSWRNHRNQYGGYWNGPGRSYIAHDRMPRVNVLLTFGIVESEQDRRIDVVDPATPEANAKMMEGPAWRSLTQGNASLAYPLFEQANKQTANSGAGLVGQSLAAAQQKKWHTAAYCMRRAFEADADGAASVEIPDEIKPALVKLSSRYKISIHRYGEDYTEAAFMRAALSQFTSDYATAQSALQDAVANGDRSTAAQNLMTTVLQKRLADSALLADYSAGY